MARTGAGEGGGAEGGMCPCKQVHRNIIKLGLGVEVGQRQRLLVRGIVQTGMGKQMRKIRARCPVSVSLAE